MHFAARLGRAARELFDLFLPPACPLCLERLPAGPAAVFCPACLAQLPPLPASRCRRCALPFADADGSDHLCGACLQDPTPSFSRVQAAGHYASLLREAIQRFKYGGTVHLDRPLGALLAARVAPGNTQVVVPVPLHPARLRQRSYNQSLLLARVLGRQLGLPVVAEMLHRVRPTPPQQGLSARVRRRNLAGAFALAAPAAGRSILLVDDVLTTGSTAGECARVLLAGGATEVEVAVVARAGLLPAPCQDARIC